MAKVTQNVDHTTIGHYGICKRNVGDRIDKFTAENKISHEHISEESKPEIDLYKPSGILN